MRAARVGKTGDATANLPGGKRVARCRLSERRVGRSVRVVRRWRRLGSTPDIPYTAFCRSQHVWERPETPRLICQEVNASRGVDFLSVAWDDRCESSVDGAVLEAGQKARLECGDAGSTCGKDRRRHG